MRFCATPSSSRTNTTASSKTRATSDSDEYVRLAAIQELARGWRCRHCKKRESQLLKKAPCRFPGRTTTLISTTKLRPCGRQPHAGTGPGDERNLVVEIRVVVHIWFLVRGTSWPPRWPKPNNAVTSRKVGVNFRRSGLKEKRQRFKQLAQTQKLKTGRAFAAEVRRSNIHPSVHKLTAWRKRNRLSQRAAVAVLQKYYFHLTFASLRSWEEGRRSPHPHTAAILEKFLNDHPTVPPPK